MADFNSDKLRPEESEGGFDADPADNVFLPNAKTTNENDHLNQSKDAIDDLLPEIDFNPTVADAPIQNIVEEPKSSVSQFDNQEQLPHAENVIYNTVSSENNTGDDKMNNQNNKLKEPGNMKKGIIVAFAMLIFVISLGILAYLTFLRPKSGAKEGAPAQQQLVQVPQSQELTQSPATNETQESGQNAQAQPKDNKNQQTPANVNKSGSMKDQIVEVIKPEDLVNKKMDSAKAAENIKKAVESKQVLKPHKPPLLKAPPQPKTEDKPVAKPTKKPAGHKKSAVKPPTKDIALNAPTVSQEPKVTNSKEPKPANVKTTQEKSPVYTVQIYTTPSRDDAEDWIKKLRSKNINTAYLVTHKVRDKIWYRVRFGQYPSYEEAKAEAVKTGFSQSWIDRIR